MTQRRVRLLAGLVALVVPMGAAALPVSASAATAGAPLVAVKHHALATVGVGAHKAASFVVLGRAGVPKTGVASVVLTVTVSKPVATGALTVYAAGAKRPTTLSVSFTSGHAASNTVVVVAGKAGKVTAYNGSVGAVHVVATVVGWYRTVVDGAPVGSYFHAVTPRQLSSTLVKKAGSLSLGTTGVAKVPGAAAKVLLQLSVLNPGGKGALTVSPAGGTRSKATAVAFVPGRSATALVTATPGLAGRVLVVSNAKVAVRVRVDLIGYLLPYNPVAAPTGVTAVGQLNSVLVSWTAPATSKGAPILHYVVTAANAQNTPLSTSVTTGAVASLAVTGLTNGTPYTFAVQAVTKSGNGPLSAYTAAVTPAGLPAAPTNLVATANGVGTALLTWTAASTNGSALVANVVTGAPGAPLNVAGTATSATLTGLTVGQRYVFTVTAQNALGSSAPSAPSAPIIVTGAAGTLVTSAVSVDTSESYHGSGVGAGTVGTSTDGRYVAFGSVSGLGGIDNNGASDIFLRDRNAPGTTTLISSDSTNMNTAGNAFSIDAAISGDGSLVAFDSNASNLVTGDTNGRSDVFLRNVAAGTTTQVSLTDAGAESATTPFKESYGPAISGDGTMVAFVSNVTDLVTGETNNGYNIYLVPNLGLPSSIKRVSLGTAGALPAPAAPNRLAVPTLSPDGHYVGYSFNATNIVAGTPAGVTQAYAFDTTSLATTLVSVGAGGVPGNGNSTPPVFSADHRYAVFQSDASNLVVGDTNGKSDVFVRDLLTGTTTRVSLANDATQGNDSSTAPSISADGTRVLFTSLATNLVVGDTNGVADAFVRYLGTNETVRVSVGANSVQAGAGADPAALVGGVALSGDGRTAFFTSGDALGAADNNAKVDLWARTLG